MAEMVDVKKGREPTIVTRKASPEDVEELVSLLNLLDPSILARLYGIDDAYHMKKLVVARNNLWSFEHFFIVEVDGKVAATIAGFDWKTKKTERIKTALLMLLYLRIPYALKIPHLLLSRSTLSRMKEGEYYLCNMVVYPQFRRMYVARMLTLDMEDEAKKEGAERMVLTIGIDNEIAVNSVKLMGYTTEGEVREMGIGKEKIRFYRFVKDIS